MSHVVEPSLVEQGKAALGRHEWREAYDLMSAGDGRGEVTGADLELYAQASWWIGRLPEAIEIRERAFAAAVTSVTTVAPSSKRSASLATTRSA